MPRKATRNGDVVRVLGGEHEGREGVVLSMFATDGCWLVAMEPGEEFPDGSVNDLEWLHRRDYDILDGDMAEAFRDRELDRAARAYLRAAKSEYGVILTPPPGVVRRAHEMLAKGEA